VKKKAFFISLLVICAIAMLCCKSKDKLFVTEKIYVTSESGHKIAEKGNVEFVKEKPEGTVIKIDPGIIRQTMDGIGSSFTESSAFVLAHLDPEKRKEVMKKAFGEEGANFSLTRTHIGACDFCVEGKYSYLDKEGDVSLSSFSLEPDREGFVSAKYPGIVDENYDLLPMIKEAMEIKSMQTDKELRIVASAWTAPYWMKDIKDWYIRGTPENNFQGTGGSGM